MAFSNCHARGLSSKHLILQIVLRDLKCCPQIVKFVDLIHRWVYRRYVAVLVESVKAVFVVQTVELVTFAWTNQSLEAEIKKDRNVVYDNANERLWWAF